LRLDEALIWTERLLGLALLLQSVELLQLRRHYADDGVWAWPLLRAEHEELPAPLRWCFALLLPYAVFVSLLALRLPLAILLGVGQLWTAPLLLLSQLAIGARFRGTFNGGSDYMSVAALLALSLAAAFGGSPRAVSASLGYVCVQLVFSYFIAGAVKLKKPAWRSGEALGALLRTNRYGTPPALRQLVSRPGVARAAAWSVMLFECGFPASLAGLGVAVPMLALGALFHALNLLAFGLNRFFFAWLAAYPSLLYFSAQLAEHP
jgi:hypothetical protein